MTADAIERFKPILEPLELERLKIVRDRKAFLFAALLVAFLGFCLLLAGFVGSSSQVVGFGIVFFIFALLVLWARGFQARAFRARLRSKFTREWFKSAYPGCYLGSAPATKDLPIEVVRSLREACIRATAQSPSRTSIEERIFFDSDTYNTFTFILRERGLFGGSRAIVWYRLISEDAGLVAYAIPSLTKAPDLRFFMNGQPTEATEPLRSKLLSLYDRLRARSRGEAVRVSLSPNGLWAGVRLRHQFFEAPQIGQSLLEASSFASWIEEAELPTDRNIMRF